jgi:hypothetical protein
MTRARVMFAAALLIVVSLSATAADLKPIRTHKAKDITVTLSSESGQWIPGKNSFVLELAKDGKPVEGGKVTLSTSMAMPGMAPMVAGATLRPDGPGRYRGTIDFPDRGERQVTVAWDGPAGKSSTRFAVPVR